MRFHILLLAGSCLAGRLVAQDKCTPARADSGTVALTGLTLWDGTGTRAAAGMTVLIRGDRILDVFRDGARVLPPATTARAMAGLYAIPGLVDAHVHVATEPSGEDTRTRSERRLCRALLGGVTVVRDMAGDVRSLASLQRDALVGDIAGPDIFYSALWAGPAFFADPRTAAASAGGKPGSFPWMRAVDSLTDLRQAVAEVRGTGATAIKLYAALSPSLVAAIVSEAHHQGLPVWAHAAVSSTTPLQVVAAGVDVVSHAGLLLRQLGPERYGLLQKAEPNEAARLMASPVLDTLFQAMTSHGTLFEPTLFVYRGGERRTLFELSSQVTRRAHAAGVPIVAGTDSLGSGDDGPWAPPNLHEELALLVTQGGLTSAEALTAATATAARALHQEQEFGTIVPGKFANLVLLERDPLADITNTTTIRWVVKRGAFYRR